MRKPSTFATATAMPIHTSVVMVTITATALETHHHWLIPMPVFFNKGRDFARWEEKSQNFTASAALETGGLCRESKLQRLALDNYLQNALRCPKWVGSNVQDEHSLCLCSTAASHELWNISCLVCEEKVCGKAGVSFQPKLSPPLFYYGLTWARPVLVKCLHLKINETVGFIDPHSPAMVPTEPMSIA